MDVEGRHISHLELSLDIILSPIDQKLEFVGAL